MEWYRKIMLFETNSIPQDSQRDPFRKLIWYTMHHDMGCFDVVRKEGCSELRGVGRVDETNAKAEASNDNGMRT